MNKNARKKAYILGGLALVLGIVALAAVFWPWNLRTALTIEAGTQELSATAFLKENNGDSISFLSDLSAIDRNIPGTHALTLLYKGREHTVQLTIEDTIPPAAEICDVSIYAHRGVEPTDFVVSIQDATAVTVALKEQPDLTLERSQTVTLVLTDLGGNITEYEAVLTVAIDTGAPVFSGVKPMYTYLGTQPDYLAGVTATDDKDPDLTILVDDSGVDLSTTGTYTVTYSVTDDAGFTATAEAAVTVTDDSQAPTILGAQSISLYLGSTVSYRKGIALSDDQDPSPTLEIDASQVDLSSPGEYPLIYIARDATGNETILEVSVTVAPQPENFVEESIIYAKADELLAQFITDDMTDEAKVRAVYAYVRSHYGYAKSTDKIDWLQGAYTMMHKGRGDCFNYFAVTKLFLERLGIPNIDVRKVKLSERSSSHYWSLVSVDGGETYYHLDTTPRVGSGDNFCLVTDAFLDAYSAAHWNSHNRDKSLYPATPAE